LTGVIYNYQLVIFPKIPYTALYANSHPRPEAITTDYELLSAHNPDLARIYTKLGAPPLWAREPGFPTLVTSLLAVSGFSIGGT
jgi:hypothetical protein